MAMKPMNWSNVETKLPGGDIPIPKSIFKFFICEKVFVKSLNKEGFINVTRAIYKIGEAPRIDYEVAMHVESWTDYSVGPIGLIRDRYQYVRVNEDDLMSMKHTIPSPDVATGDRLDQIDFTYGLMRLPEQSDEDLRAILLEALRRDPSTPKPKACECGMEKHGFANHSTWCPKHGI